MILRVPFSNTSIRLTRLAQHPMGLAGNDSEEIQKIFVVGFGKTGTSTLRKTFQLLGINVGEQAAAEMLIKEVYQGDFERLIRYCNTADAFQDIPFMMPGVYQALDQAFPNSKFILSVRDTPEQWFDSKVKSHTQSFSSNVGQPPNELDCERAIYRYKGYLMDTAKYIWKFPDVPLYDKDGYIKIYEKHNADVEDYFRGRTKDFIKINVARQSDFDRLMKFLKVKTRMSSFPWENKTK